ncbi:MAG: hypothetical protein J5737_03995 [Bacteroidales bacterium]|nr:hypothetical protein [Bacteroidales bacterium]
MAFRRIHHRELPDGSIQKVYPFHISLEGMESTLICRDDEDYDALQKRFYVSAWSNNSIVVADIEMSNHGHLIVLSTDMSQARNVAAAIKKDHSQYLANKYHEHNTLVRSDVKVIYLDTDWYLRNALAYVPRNALDAGVAVGDYKWSSYGAMFSSARTDMSATPVASMTRREKEFLFHTHADLKRVPWKVDIEGRLITASACDHNYAERAFNNDQAFFLKTIGSVNCAEMDFKLVTGPRIRRSDNEFRKTVEELSHKWFNIDISGLSMEMKTRIVPHLYHSYNTSVPQLARCIMLSREDVAGILRIR